MSRREAHALRTSLVVGRTGWPTGSVDREDPSLYHGLAGVVMALHEAHVHFGDDRYGEAAARGAEALTAQVEVLDDSSLYFGLTGVAVALHALGRDDAARRALQRVRAASTGSAGTRCSSCSWATPASDWARCRPGTWIWP